MAVHTISNEEILDWVKPQPINFNLPQDNPRLLTFDFNKDTNPLQMMLPTYKYTTTERLRYDVRRRRFVIEQGYEEAEVDTENTRITNLMRLFQGNPSLRNILS